MVWKGESAIVVSVLVCATVIASEPKKFVKVEYFLNKKILYTEESFHNATILYNACDIDNRRTELTCEVIQQTKHFNGTERRLSCPLNLVDVDDKFIKTYPVGRDRAVIVYIDSRTAPVKKYLQLLNIDLNGCKTTRNEVIIPPTDVLGSTSWNIRLITVLPYGDKYDVIFNYQFSCSSKFCKGTFDLEGNAVTEISSWDQVSFKKFVTDIVNVNYYSPADGYLIIYKDNKKIVANLIQDDTKLLNSWDLGAVNVTPNIIYSTNGGAIGICVQFNQTGNCSFFDLEGNVKLKANLESGEEQLYAVYNLADGFLILSQACLDPNFKKPVVFCKNQKFFVKRYNSQGKLLKKVPVDDFRWDKFDYIVFGRFFQNEAGEYCASLASYLFELQAPKADVPQSVELAAQCFTNPQIF